MNAAVLTAERPKILIIDDERFNLNVLNSLLNQEYKIMVALNGEQGLRAASSGRPDLILLDITMPGMDGYAVCQRLKADRLTRDIPVMFITGLTDSEHETRGFEVGAADYIAKPFNAGVVQARVRTQIRLKLQNDLLASYAFRDGLTGLANRRAFDERLDMEWNRCKRSGSPLSLVLLDVDHFKHYNDHYGHAQGDDCLRAVSAVLAGQVRRTADLVARYGGEEFVALLPGIDAAQALQVAEGMRVALAARQIAHAASDVADHVTASLGLATVVPSAQWAPGDLLKAADAQLYQAKAAGRNRVAASTI